MTRKDIDNIISIICPNDEDFEKACISPAYLKKELEALALEQEPSSDLVSKQAVMNCFKKWQPYIATRLWDFEQELSKLPPVNPQEPKAGHWIYIGNKDIKHSMKIVECDSCHKRNYGSSDYCPNCGAKMVDE